MVYSIELLGQSGCFIKGPGISICIDPYLSHSVQELDSADLRRLVPIPYNPEEITDLDWVLVTHEHIDHCDPHTLPALSKSSPKCQFFGPVVVCEILKGWGVEEPRIHPCKEDWVILRDDVRVRAVPAAHPSIERDPEGNLRAVGYLLQFSEYTIYIAGDTGLTEEVLEALKGFDNIDIALLPVNEQNFYRDRQNIIGNMSIRDAFSLAEDVGIKTVIPVHWDMFQVNSVTPEEIRAVYKSMKPNFKLLLDPNLVYEFSTRAHGGAV